MKLLNLVLLSTLAAAAATGAPAIARAAQPPSNMQQLQPIRQAKAHIAITKYTWKTSPNPSTQADRVCEKDVDAPVFDVRGTSGNFYYQLGSMDCMSTVHTKAVKVSLNSALMLTDKNDPVDHTDRKYFHAIMNVGYPIPGGTEAIPGLESGVSAWSHDINIKTIGLDMQPSIQWICLAPEPGHTEPFPDPKAKTLFTKKIFDANQPAFSCSPMVDEWFTASVEFVD